MRGKMSKADEDVEIKPVDENELPPEFKKFDKPFGLEQHVWNIIFYGIIAHVAGIYGIYLFLFGIDERKAFIFWFFAGYATCFGATVGTHRYWTHKTFKAKLPLQILLMLLQTSAIQYPIFKWARDHRVHHKYTDTNADPHSAARGFWFSHFLWFFQPKHPDLEKALKVVDISDLARDPVVRFQSKYYWELVLLVCGGQTYLCHLIFPHMTLIGVVTSFFARFLVSLHITWLVNSVAHKWGNKPYDKEITSTESKLVSLLSTGEGWHNYHHTFPWDYKAAEYGYYYNASTMFIHFFAMLGLASDMKTVSHKMLVDRINRTGNGSHPFHDHHHEKSLDDADTSYSHCWGWGDENLKKEDIEITETRFPAKKNRGL